MYVSDPVCNMVRCLDAQSGGQMTQQIDNVIQIYLNFKKRFLLIFEKTHQTIVV